MPAQSDQRRLTTMCEQQPTPQAQPQDRWSAPVQPTASLVQPGHADDLGSPPVRPPRAPAYPLSNRPLLDQQDRVQTSSSNHNTSQQTSPQPLPHHNPARQAAPGAEPPAPTTRGRISQLAPPGVLVCICQVLCPGLHDEPGRNHPITSPPPRPSISYPIVPPDNHPVDQFEDPRPAPLPPTLARPGLSPATLSPPIIPPSPSTPPPPYSPTPDQASINGHARAPANRRPLSVPPPPREFSSPFATDFPDARHWCSGRQSLQLGRFALCGACHRVRHCAIGLGAGRVVCDECFREHFLDGKE